ncbi:MAG: phosphate acyltransferase PlsX [Eubacteriaceae bacterium]|nr:phosphate acyltransferase PlsX [Eubacteriaceae bacterium]
MTIYLDAMGGDNAPVQIIEGAVAAVAEYGINVTLIGDEAVINNVFENRGLSRSGIDIINATEKVEMTEEPVAAVRKKKDSPMVRGALLVKGSHEDAFISAGSTGAVLAAATLYCGRIKGVSRPALGTLVNIKKPVMVLDNGANADCRPEYLDQFARMGAAYIKAAAGVEDPKVGLLNIGTEDIKGNALIKEAFGLLRDDPKVNFVGNVEASGVFDSDADVVVCDGFSGNILVKAVEGTAKLTFGIVKDVLMGGALNKLAALIIKKDLYEKKDLLDPRAYGGAPLLGTNATVIKAHGNSDATAIKNAIRQADKLVRAGMLSALEEAIKQQEENR